MTKSNAEYQDAGWVTVEKVKNSLIAETQDVVREHFPKSSSYYNNLSKNDFHQICLNCQNDINKNLDFQKRFFETERDAIEQITQAGEFLSESLVFLRAIRPTTSAIKDNVGLHRETMYSDSEQTQFCHNIWLPILNVCESNTLRFIPKSHTVSDEDITVEVDNEAGGKVERFSAGHKLGNLYAPKKIVGGVDTTNTSPMNVLIGEYLLFSAMLVHGAAVNPTDNIRFSLSMATIPRDRLQDNKSYQAADGKPHYSSLS